ncbi:hypothetical protein D0Z07_9077 [Hyphodiscus hymeniophilus]|uniref:Uncharacterized protein n=1 Tax=Hyphodiscus hymeniophilus TaxID=353542 RepID=A0A9P6SJN2_9HELO|nr:hypothetical protein D0Z07_9077 [Hyphodiscus hymeniophilus]
MAGRSFKPASYLTCQPTKRSPRPSFARSSSASSTQSNNSEDSFVTTLRTLSTTDHAAGKHSDPTSLASIGGASLRCHTPVSNPSSLARQAIEDTPGRKRSQPIAIELPPRPPPVYTPLTARGELKGGYFPFHDTFSKSYKSNAIPKDEREHYDDKSVSRPLTPVNMSNDSSAMASPAETSRQAPTSVLSPAFATNNPVPEVLAMPMGKYHPANYKEPPKAPTSAPTLHPTHMSLPSSVPDRKKKRPAHERHASDVKRKLQEYQMGQARNAAMLANLSGGKPEASEPISPRLAPLGSPGPITPFELEESTQAGYMVAGASRSMTNEGLLGRGLERERDRELVGRMIRAEEERRVMIAKEGSQSPGLQV